MTFWAKVVYCSNYFLNLVSTRIVIDMTPVEKWRGRKPSIDHLKTFELVSWAHINNDYRKKLDSKSHACIMMGDSNESKANRLFDPIKQHIIFSRIVFFDETISGKQLLNSSNDPLNNDIFYILEESGSAMIR